MDWTTWLKALGIFLSGSVITFSTLFGLSRWFGDAWLGWLVEKQKAKYATELENIKAKFNQELEHYRATLDRPTFVTRAHFETEFEAYKRVFEGLAEVRLAMTGARPTIELSPPNESLDDRLKRLRGRLDLLTDAHDKTIKIIEHLSPFYPQDIYSKLGECLFVVRGEILDIRTGGDERTFSHGWYVQGKKRLDEFFPKYNAVSEAIRGRIEAMAIIPN